MLWRAAIGCLPTKSQLISRRVPIDAWCPSCGVALESIVHCLINCDFAIACWHRSGLASLFIFIDENQTLFVDWLASMFIIFDENQRILFAMVCWMIWKARNDFVWKHKRTSPASVVFLANTILVQWSRAQDKVNY